ncbi:YebC-like protein [Paxillus ammoniavirescens]|nr:YebC-like protein [Paxillus ammoniavirescens]
MFSRALLRSRRHVSLSRTLSTTPTRFAGHSKWSKIKHRKGLEDAKKSKLYGKAAREILAAAKTGGSTNPEENGLLATVIRRAKDAGVPKENVEKALAKAERTEGHGQAMLFEAIINGTTGIIIECRSDNTNRTVKNINHTLTSYKARASPVKFMFQQRGYVKVQIGDDMEALLDQIMDVCSIDFADWSEESGQRGVELVCRPEVLNKVMKVIHDHAPTSPLCEVLTSEVNWAPLESQEVEDDEGTARLESLIEALEEDDDVERVYTTVEPNRLIADC